MTRLAETTARIASMNELLDIVGAMRSLAGMRMQEAQRALLGVRRHGSAIASAIAETPAPLHEEAPASTVRAGAATVLITSEHGFVGGFNERILEELERAANRDGLFVLGTRGAALARDRNRTPTWIRAMATRTGAIAEAVSDLTAELYRRIAAGEIARVEVVYARCGRAGTYNIQRRMLLPIDPAPLIQARGLKRPLINLAPDTLREKLFAEYVVALLSEAAVESLASENAARFAAMDSAHGNVSKRLEELQQKARQMRQDEITSELLELATGAEAARR